MPVAAAARPAAATKAPVVAAEVAAAGGWRRRCWLRHYAIAAAAAGYAGTPLPLRATYATILRWLFDDIDYLSIRHDDDVQVYYHFRHIIFDIYHAHIIFEDDLLIIY